MDDDAALKRVGAPSMDDDMGTKRSRVDDGAMFLKVLLPERSVGNVIGKEGTVLKKIMEESGSRIRISAMDEVLPMTRERIATICGPVASLLRAQQLISAVLAEPRQGEDAAPPAERTLKLLMSNGAIGAIIGKGGAVIKEIMSLTGASLKVSQPNEAIVQTQERVLTLTGNVHAVDAAQNEICLKLAVAPVGQQLKETDYKVLKQLPPPLQYQQMAGSMAAMGAPYGMPWIPQQAQRHALPPAANGPVSYKQFMATLADDVSPEEAQRQYQDYLRTVGADAVVRMGGGGGGKPVVGGTAITHQLPLPDKIVSGIIGKGGLVSKDAHQPRQHRTLSCSMRPHALLPAATLFHAVACRRTPSHAIAHRRVRSRADRHTPLLAATRRYR